jgi:benzoyl-CoA reductase/2-hydroxyglutaryl-CoA dehydratase subunit BcrC/BadD/HgdB
MRTVAYNSSFVPPEWVEAHGFRPGWMRLRATDDNLPVSGVCPYARASFDAALSDGLNPIIVLTTTCNQMRHTAELIARDSHTDVFLFNVPSTWQSGAAERLYIEELQRLGRFLVQLGGQAPSPEKLAKVMLEHDLARRSLKDARHGLSARQFIEAATSLHGKPAAVVDATIGPAAPGDIPLALVGGHFLESDYGLLDVIERAGGRLVLDTSEGGERSMPAVFDRQKLEEDPLAELANAYFHGHVDIFRRPNSEFFQWLARELVARKVRGVLFRRYVWCDLWHAELYRLKQQSPVPVLDIDLSERDSGLSGRTAGRIEAFLEMLQRTTTC